MAKRSILDIVMTAIEIIHCMKSKVQCKKGNVALKLDINKAYDMIDWSYLQWIMSYDKNEVFSSIGQMDYDVC